jgi:ribosomal protein S18 acetylase RimI-like enzyme
MGGGILARAMASFTRVGLSESALEVATNNPAARRPYERLGFQVRMSRHFWRKELR